MVLPPLPSLLIALGLLFLSIVIVNTMKKPPLVGKNTARTLLACSVLLLVIGFTLHFREPVSQGRPSVESKAPPSHGAADGPNKAAPWRFSFDPKSVRWGQEVEIRLTPAREDVTVYYNGTPLPARSKGNGVFVVRVPSMSKTGYFALDCGGVKVEAEERLVVSAY